jgi:hypothetical protein
MVLLASVYKDFSQKEGTNKTKLPFKGDLLKSPREKKGFFCFYPDAPH